MKWFLLIITTLLLLVAALLALLFTPPGNALMSPVLEKIIAEKLGIRVELKHFRLGIDHFETTLTLPGDNTVEAAGNFSLLSETLSVRYAADVRDLVALKALTKQPLRGSFSTKGSVTGKPDRLRVDGTGDIAHGTTAYGADIVGFAPAAVTLSLKDASIGELLYMLFQPAFADGRLFADVNMTAIDGLASQGNVRIGVREGRFDTAVMRDEFNVTLPKTLFTLESDNRLVSGSDTYTLHFDSNLGIVRSSGTVAAEPFSADAAFEVDIKELAMLTPLTKRRFNGPLALSGTVKGDKQRLDADVKSTIAGSDSRLRAVLTQLQPRSADVDIRHLKLNKLLHLLDQPLYADADIDMTAAFADLRPGTLDGNMQLDVTRGKADRAVVAKTFGWPTFRGTTFSAKSSTTLKTDTITTKLDALSDLVTLHADAVRFNVGTQILASDFTATLPDLERLIFLTERPLRGSVNVTGDLTVDKTTTLHANSNLLGGRIRSTLKDEKLEADLKGINTLQALHMLYYPEVFDASLDGTLAYDIVTKKGEMKALLSQGFFTRNSAFDLLRQYSTIDLYRERFNGDGVMRIDDARIDADLALRSNRSSLKTQHAKIDTNAKTIDADVHLDANNNPVDFRLKGALEHPNVSVDAGKLIEREAGKQINRLLNDLFK